MVSLVCVCSHLHHHHTCRDDGEGCCLQARLCLPCHTQPTDTGWLYVCLKHQLWHNLIACLSHMSLCSMCVSLWPHQLLCVSTFHFTTDPWSFTNAGCISCLSHLFCGQDGIRVCGSRLYWGVSSSCTRPRAVRGASSDLSVPHTYHRELLGCTFL